MRLAKPDSSALGTRSWPRFLGPWPRSVAFELMDGPGLDLDDLSANLRDIRRVNRFFGGTATVLRHLPSLVADIPAGQPITILDLATGSADIPVALSHWARRNRRTMTITASDSSPEMLLLARRHIGDRRNILPAQHDARAVSEPDASYDIVLCSLALHHFSPDEAVRVLREMRRLSRVGFIVNDLRRSRRGYAVTWLASHLTTRNRLTRHDAPLSIRRAYTREELVGLLGKAGIRAATVRTHAWFRMAAIIRTERPNA